MTSEHLYQKIDFTKVIANILQAAADFYVSEDTTMEEQKVQLSNVRSKLACRRAEDEKIVSLILEMHKPKHVCTWTLQLEAKCNITSALFIQMVSKGSSKLKSF